MTIRCQLGLLTFVVVACGSAVVADDDDTSTTSGGGGSTATQGGGGSADGGDAEPCPENATDCRALDFTANEACTFVNEAAGTPCNDGALPCDGSDASAACICDGLGACVQCIDGGDCAPPDLCVNGACIMGDRCLDGVLNDGETATGSGSGQTDGDGAGNDCGGPNCAPCIEGEACGSAADCLSHVCDMGGGGAGGGPNGTCVVCQLHTDCPSDRYCDTDGNPDRCASDLAGGSANVCGSLPDNPQAGSSADEECVGNADCVDGYCCDGACSGPCQHCGLVGTEGVCTMTPQGADLDGDCPNGCCLGASAACGAANCNFGEPCDANGDCTSDNCFGAGTGGAGGAANTCG